MNEHDVGGLNFFIIIIIIIIYSSEVFTSA